MASCSQNPQATRFPLADERLGVPRNISRSCTRCFFMAGASGSFFHLHLVSDSTGETLITVGRAAAAQYESVTAVEHVYPLVRTQKQLERVIAEIEASPGIVLYTMIDANLATRLETRCRDFGVPCLSILGPVLQLLQSYLGAATTPRIGAQHTLNAEYFKR